MLIMRRLEQGPLGGQLVYRAEDYEIDFDQIGTSQQTEAGTASLLLGTLQIDFDVSSGELIAPWGLLPHTRWVVGPLSSLVGVDSARLAIAGVRMDTGVAIAIGTADEWTTNFDASRGQLQLSMAHVNPDTFVEFATGCVLGLSARRPVVLRLSPRFDW
jgi:hypothetical protein